MESSTKRMQFPWIKLMDGPGAKVQGRMMTGELMWKERRERKEIQSVKYCIIEIIFVRVDA